MKPIRIDTIAPYDWTKILDASKTEGYDMVDRLLVDFQTGSNSFDATGEALFVYLSGKTAVAVAGLNREPDSSYMKSGRIRRLYVLPEYRNKGLARSLIEVIASLAETTFDRITVNVGILDARGFYKHLGFTPVNYPGITHIKEL